MAKRPAKKARNDAKPPTSGRADGWRNVLTGIGMFSRDKRKHNRVEVPELDRQTLEDLWEADDMAARIIEAPVDEMHRNGFELTVHENASDTGTTDPEDASGGKYDAAPPFAQAKPGAPMIPTVPSKPPGPIEPRDQEGKQTSDATVARYQELLGPDAMRLAGHYERAYGGAAIICGIDDGTTDLTKPLNEDNIKSFNWMNVLTPREMQAVRYYGDPMAPKYGMPEIYRIIADVNMQTDLSSSSSVPVDRAKDVMVTAEIHESRCIVFPGLSVSRRHRLRKQGWGNSVFVRVVEILSDFQMAYSGAAHLLSDFSQAVLKVKGLADLVAQNDDATVIKRVQLLDMSRSMARMLLIDEAEEFKREVTPLTGLPEMLERFEHRLSAAVDMPRTLLMGASPGGLGSNGDQEVRFFYDRIRAKQQRDLKPRLTRLLKLIMLAKDGPTKGTEPENWDIEFAPLWSASDLEQSTMRWNVAQADGLYITQGVVTAEEVAASRFGGPKWSPETHIDLEQRQQLTDDYEDAKAKAEDAQTKAAAMVTTPGDLGKSPQLLPSKTKGRDPSGEMPDVG